MGSHERYVEPLQHVRELERVHGVDVEASELPVRLLDDVQPRRAQHQLRWDCWLQRVQETKAQLLQCCVRGEDSTKVNLRATQKIAKAKTIRASASNRGKKKSENNISPTKSTHHIRGYNSRVLVAERVAVRSENAHSLRESSANNVTLQIQCAQNTTTRVINHAKKPQTCHSRSMQQSPLSPTPLAPSGQ